MGVKLILPSVLHESLILRKEHRQGVFNSRVLGKIIRLKRFKVIGDWRRLHSEELYDLTSTPDINWVKKSSRVRRVGHMAHKGV